MDLAATTPDGRRMYVDPADPRAHDLVAAGGDLNPLSLVLWRRVLAAHPWEVVVDVGVNYGEMLVGSVLPQRARVIGFEPNPRIRGLVSRTLAENGIGVDLRAEAVSDRPGTARFAVDSTWSGTSSLDPGGLVERDRWEFLDVAVTTLDEVLGPQPPSFCVKVDVEGFEREVLAGAARSMAAPVPWVLMLEVLHMAPGFLAALAEEHAVLVLPRDGGGLVRLEGSSADRVLASGEVYPQDCLVAGPRAVSLLRA